MNPLKLDLTSSSRFTVSLGALYIFLGLAIIYYYSFQRLDAVEQYIMSWFYMAVLFFVGFKMFIKGGKRLVKEEKFLKKYRAELMVNQIISQDLNFQELRLKNIEANLKAKEYNKKYNDIKYETSKHRDFRDIGRQIVNLSFYEDVYGKSKKKKN